MSKHTLCLVFALWQTIATALADARTPELSERIDAIFAPWNRTNSPGMAVTVVSNGNVLHLQGYGMASLEHRIPITAHTVFDAASVAKQFTGMALAMLVQDGKLRLEDEIHQYVPDTPNFGHPINLGHLVHHTSGLRDWPIMLHLAGWRWEDVITFRNTLDMLRHQRDLNFVPGDAYAYCNTGYNLLVAAMEKVTGQQFSTWTEQRIFQPLGMGHTHFHCEQNEWVENFAQCYEPAGETKFNKIADNLTAVGSSSLFTTIEDLTLWLKNFDTAAVGGPAVLAAMKQEGVLNNGGKTGYGLGLAVGKHRGLEMVNHTGGWAGFASFVLYFPQQKTGVALLSNLGSINSYELGMKVAEICLAQEMAAAEASHPKSPPPPKTSITLATNELDQITGVYICTTRGIVRRILQKGSTLFYSRGNQGQSEMVPLSSQRFQLAGTPRLTEIQFIPEAGENKIRLRVQAENEGTLEFRQGLEKSYHANELAEYAGVYRSPELEARYRVWVENEQLKIRAERKADEVWSLQPECQDIFNVASQAQIRFLRDSRQVIKRLTYSDERNWNVSFEKESSLSNIDK